MSKDLTISFLLDFYGRMLTEKQREVVELYYNADLSLAEIAAHSGITRQGVRDSIKRAEGQLREYEQQLGLAGKFQVINRDLAAITQAAKEIDLYNDRYGGVGEISRLAGQIVSLAGGISETYEEDEDDEEGGEEFDGI